MSSADTEVQLVPAPEPQPAPPQQPSESVESPQPVAQQDSHDEEYESADDAYEEEEIEEIEVEEEVDEDDEEYNEEADAERSASQQEKENKELDDDEDAKNPQFIPKRGYFYEHDDRTKPDEEEEVEEPKKEEKKKPPKEPERWTHDLYNENDQTPKSKEELQQAYGYDIWTDDQAPRARRRRRYGRGPAKYDRKWEDDEAYQKPRGGGFRGRGSRGGRGNFRGSNRRSSTGAEDNSEEFPALPGQEIKSPAPLLNKSQPQPQQQSSKPPAVPYKDRPAPDRTVDRRISGEGFRPNFDNRRRDEYDSERHAGPGGMRGGGGRGGRGRGRRNEFSNRNRYPNRRDEAEAGNEPPPMNPIPHKGADREIERPRPQGQRQNTTAASPSSGKSPQQTHVQANGHMREKDNRGKETPLSSKPPFTNTEYTGSHSLTANRHKPQTQGQATEDHSKKGQGQPQTPQSNVLAEKGYSDLREMLNAKRQQQAPVSNQGRPHNQNPVPQHHHQPIPQHHQAPPHHAGQQGLDQGMVGGKPKRFSARQRQGEPQMGNAPSSVGAPMGHPNPNMIPVVSAAEGMVPPSVQAYPQAPPYYDGPQVYEASGSPVTVAAVATNGTSVSPSLWAPHAYANAPYPSPPTGPQGPPPAFADHAAYLAAQQGGPMYTAPPQFIQDPSMMNYNAGAPPFAPTAFHPPGGYQGFPQVQAPPPPEIYHGGMAYYNPQPQIHRQPMMGPSKQAKRVLQLVEPPEKASPRDRSYMKERHSQSQSQSPPVMYASDPNVNANVHGHVEQAHAELTQQFENVSLTSGHEDAVEQRRKPSPLPKEQESWSAQMEEIISPGPTTTDKQQQRNIESSSGSAKDGKSPTPEETQKDRTSPVEN